MHISCAENQQQLPLVAAYILVHSLKNAVITLSRLIPIATIKCHSVISLQKVYNFLCIPQLFTGMEQSILVCIESWSLVKA